MNIFKKRPLSLILCIMLGGFSLFIDSSYILFFVAIGISIFTFILSFFINLNKYKNILRISLICFLISIILAKCFALSFIQDSEIKDDISVNAQVTDIDKRETLTVLTLETEHLNGIPGKYKLLASLHESEAYQLQVGDLISLNGNLRGFAESSSGFNEFTYYRSKGYSAEVTDISDITLVKRGDTIKLDSLEALQINLSNMLINSTDERVGGFLAALIMGNKDYLDKGVELDFQIIGISHILALSGMHLVILSEGIKAILNRLKLNKKWIIFFSTLFCLFYMALTGFSPSVVRSALMLTITNTLFLFSSTHDSYTTLPLSVCLIIIIDPYAVYDLSLWLSAFATLGILVYSEIERKRSEEKKKSIFRSILNGIISSLLATLFAVGASYFLMLQHFDTFSVISPIATLVFSVPINLLIFVGIFLIPLGFVDWFGKAVIIFTEFIFYLVQIVSDWNWAIISLHFPLIIALIVVFSIIYFSFLVIKLKNPTIITLTISVLFVIISITGICLTQAVRYSDEKHYSSSSRYDASYIQENGEISLIYSGAYNKTTAYDLASDMQNQNITTVDRLILVRYEFNTQKYIEAFTTCIKTNTVFLPTPKSDNETEIVEIIARQLSNFGTSLELYDEEEPISLGETVLFLISRTVLNDNVESDAIYTLRINGDYHTFISSGASETLSKKFYLIAPASKYLYFGRCGSDVNASINIFSDKIEGIYYTSKQQIGDGLIDYYGKKEVPIEKIDTSIFIH